LSRQIGDLPGRVKCRRIGPTAPLRVIEGVERFQAELDVTLFTGTADILE
jgi:hypothetical protein